MELGKPCAGKPPARFDEGSEAKTAAPAKCLPPRSLLAYSTRPILTLAQRRSLLNQNVDTGFFPSSLSLRRKAFNKVPKLHQMTVIEIQTSMILLIYRERRLPLNGNDFACYPFTKIGGEAFFGFHDLQPEIVSTNGPNPEGCLAAKPASNPC